MKKRKAPELKFQEHIARFLAREHKYAQIEKSETDNEHHIAEDRLWDFVTETQPDAIKELENVYGTVARDEFFRELREALRTTPMWLVIRTGLTVRERFPFKLYFPKPRSGESAAGPLYRKNKIAFRHHYYFGPKDEEIDFVFFLNGLPIVTMELKHEKNQTVEDAVAQYVARDQGNQIFKHPFLHIAADTSEVKVATDPGAADNFQWFNTGLVNKPMTKGGGEYPVEFMYREALSRERLIEAVEFFLVHVPKRDAQENRPEEPEYTLFPRYHQSRMVRAVADEAVATLEKTGTIGRKFLIAHSAGSGKTLSMCWLADRLQSLYDPKTNAKLVDIVLILTDRRSLNKNIKDDIGKFAHLNDIVGIAKKSDDLDVFLRKKKAIIVTTLQKFEKVLSELQSNPDLKKLRVAYLIDEAHRSQEGKLAVAIRAPFRNPDKAEKEEDEEETVARIIREKDANQLFVAFTATPSPATLQLFGQAFDTYTEAEAIREDYIVDVAGSIISYKTLYNLYCPLAIRTDTQHPAGLVSRALKSVAYQDEGLIQYKAEVMLRIFDEKVKSLIGGRAKAMVVATSRVAGLRYFEIIKEKLRERGADYKVLYAFSPFVHPETKNDVTEFAVNGMAEGEDIEDRFEQDDYRLLVVANKFQTGFDQPKLAGMFLDKVVSGRNAIQTVSRLNRKFPGKKDVVVVDFTNNARAILTAFARYRRGATATATEPDQQLCLKLYKKILKYQVFTQADADEFAVLLKEDNDAKIQAAVNSHRVTLQKKLSTPDARRDFVNLLAKFASTYYFLKCFFAYSVVIERFAAFAEYVGPQLMKASGLSDLMKQIRATQVLRAAVQSQGVVTGRPVRVRKAAKANRPPPTQPKVSVQDMIKRIKRDFRITKKEALFIRQVTEAKTTDPAIKETVAANRDDLSFLDEVFKEQVNNQIQAVYAAKNRINELGDPKYIDPGAIFDLMAFTVIHRNLDQLQTM